MNNTITKVAIPVETIYKAINSPETLNAQSIIARNSAAGEALSVNNVSEYTAMNAAVKDVSDAIKSIEAARKAVTVPIDNFKKEIMKLERDATAPMLDFIEDAKKRMVEYHERLESERKAAEDKLRAEAAASMEQTQSVVDVLSTFTDRLYATSVETNHTKNIRTTIKARTVGEVDWVKVLSVQFAFGNLTAEDLLNGLPKAMKEMGVDSIEGIELYESKTQVIR